MGCPWTVVTRRDRSHRGETCFPAWGQQRRRAGRAGVPMSGSVGCGPHGRAWVGQPLPQSPAATRANSAAVPRAPARGLVGCQAQGVGKQSEPDPGQSPPAPPTSLSQKQFLPTVQPGAYLPPTSRPGLQFPWSPLQWSSRPPGWVGPGLRGRRHCQGPPGKCCRLPRVLGKVFAGSPAPAALAVVDSFESRRGPRSMFATRPCACGEPVTSPTLCSRRARWLPRNPPGPWRAVGVWRPAVRASETAVTVSSVSQAGAEAGRNLGKRAV